MEYNDLVEYYRQRLLCRCAAVKIETLLKNADEQTLEKVRELLEKTGGQNEHNN